MPVKVNFISLGCPKNLVDSEFMVGALKERGFEVSFDMDKKADCAVVNTCGFIKDAQEESVDIICELIELKRQGLIKKLVVAGCLSQRYKEELKKELKEVDAFTGVNDPAEVSRIIEGLLNGKSTIHHSPFTIHHPRTRLTPSHYAYLKLSEGCRHSCSFCAIPKIRGGHHSRPMEDIIEEAKGLLDEGVKELNLVGQDTTSYGVDLYSKSSLTLLLKKLIRIKNGKHWIRLLYAHPRYIDDGLIEVIANEGAMCKYIDVPLQHINDRILKLMRRGIDKKKTFALIEKIRRHMPDVSLRTSLIVGFPTETKKEFDELMDFLREVEFERLGVFIYSNEEGTSAHDLKPQVSENERKDRFDAVMSLQRSISKIVNEKMLGKKLEVLIDECDEKDPSLFIGRTQADAPEVDGCAYVKSKRKLNPGDFVSAKIIDTYEYDLVGERVSG